LTIFKPPSDFVPFKRSALVKKSIPFLELLLFFNRIDILYRLEPLSVFLSKEAREENFDLTLP